MGRRALAIVIGGVGLGAMATGAVAQLPPGVYAGEPSLKDVVSGSYRLDPDHTAVIAKVSHIGYGLSVFRFDKVEGTLVWNAADPTRSTLRAVVHTVSIATPVPGFAKELIGPGYLNVDRFPDATFVSTAFHRTDATHGKVEGQFTLMGQTRPLTFDVSLGGAGKGFMGHPRIGVEAHAAIAPTAFGLAAMFGPTIRIEVDAEFEAG
jgi:polyisoprenoid-binding protein YceI